MLLSYMHLIPIITFLYILMIVYNSVVKINFYSSSVINHFILFLILFLMYREISFILYLADSHIFNQLIFKS